MIKLGKYELSSLAVVALAIAAMEGCGGGGSQTAPPSTSHAGTSSTSAGSGGADTSGAGTGSTDGGAAGADESTGGTAGTLAGGSGGGSDDACTSPTTGCYKCAPKTNAQFLNACGKGDGTCSLGYDNSLVPALVANNGKLPPLP
jgi:hypothetical protein